METGKLEALKLLRKPFEAHQISKLPKPYKKDSPKGKCTECGGFHGLPAMHLSYVGHAALTDRLLDVDPLWTWEPLTVDQSGLPQLDKDGGLWIKLTVCGVTRLGYGDAQGKSGGDAMKERIGDALRNAAMRFGAALDLWHKGDLHVDDAEEDGKGTECRTATQAAKPTPAAKAKPEEVKADSNLDKIIAGIDFFVVKGKTKDDLDIWYGGPSVQKLKRSLGPVDLSQANSYFEQIRATLKEKQPA